MTSLPARLSAPDAPPVAGGERTRRLLIVVVPALNEAGRVERAVEELRAQAAALAPLGVALRVYVIDDGSQDGTHEAASAAGADRVLRHRENMGLGAAVRTGLIAARTDGADIVVKFDADLQHEASEIVPLIGPILRDEANIVYGNRFERIAYRMPIVRRLGNVVFTALMRWLTGWPLRDSQPGIFAVDRAFLQQFYLPGDYNYTQQILLDAFHRGMRFAHAPVSFRRREGGASFVSLRYPFKVLPQIVMVLAGVKPMKVFAPIGLLFMTIGAMVFCWQFGRWLAGASPKPVISVNLVLGTGLFGLQTLFFGILAELIIRRPK